MEGAEDRTTGEPSQSVDGREDTVAGAATVCGDQVRAGGTQGGLAGSRDTIPADKSPTGQVSRLRALYAIGYDVLATNPNASQTRRALSTLDTVVVQDMFLSEIAREVADVFLPVAQVTGDDHDHTTYTPQYKVTAVRLDPA